MLDIILKPLIGIGIAFGVGIAIKLLNRYLPDQIVFKAVYNSAWFISKLGTLKLKFTNWEKAEKWLLHKTLVVALGWYYGLKDEAFNKDKPLDRDEMLKNRWFKFNPTIVKIQYILKGGK